MGLDAKAYPLDLGKNIRGKVDGNILTMQVDLSADHGKSNSGKTTIIASTGGNRGVTAGAISAKLGVNIYK